MNWDDLKIVLAVSRAGTLAGAARMLRVSDDPKISMPVVAR